MVLFDEIEKAHPDVFNILLQVLEDGRLTDSHGRVVDFKNTVIIMTSNLGSSAIAEPKRLGFTTQAQAEIESEKETKAVSDALKQAFRPEFLSRLDEIVIFHKLSDEDIKKIARLMLKEISKRIEEKNIGITFGDDVIEQLAKEGFDPVYGARPLRRAMQRKIEDSLSTELLDGSINTYDKVEAYMDADKVRFKKVGTVEHTKETSENTDNSSEDNK